MENIITIEEFEPKNLVFNDPKTNSYGGTIPVHYQCPRRGKIPFILKLPRCPLPFGASQFPQKEKVVKGEENKVNYSLNVSFAGYKDGFKNNPKIGLLFKKWEKMEKVVHKEIVRQSQRLLDDDIDSVKVLEKMFYPIIKHSYDKKTKEKDLYDPTFSIKLRRYGKDGEEPKFNAKVINHKNEPVSFDVNNIFDVFTRYSEFRPLIQCTSINKGAKLAMSFSAVQVKTYPGKNQISGNAFADDSDDDESDSKDASSESPDAVADSDNESGAESGAESGDESEENVEDESDSD